MGGVRVRPQLTLVLYGLLVSSGAAALWAQRNPAGVPVAVARAAPWVFLAFAVGFAAYRFSLVAAKHYSPFKAFFQVGIAFTAFFLLLKPEIHPGAITAQHAAMADLPALYRDSDPTVRALAAEVARYRPDGAATARSLVPLLKDENEGVRTVAHQTLVQFNSGTDLGTEVKPWAERFP